MPNSLISFFIEALLRRVVFIGFITVLSPNGFFGACAGVIETDSSIVGSVSDHLSARTIPKAQVRVRHLRGKTIQTVTADERGKFEICGVPRGAYALIASAVGYSSSDNIGSSIINLFISEERTVFKAELTLMPLLEIRGLVSSPEGVPLAKIRVDALLKISNQGPVFWTKVWSGSSQSDGSFVAEKLLPGQYLFATFGAASTKNEGVIQAGFNFYPSGGPVAALTVDLLDTRPRRLKIEHPPQAGVCHSINISIKSDFSPAEKTFFVLRVTSPLNGESIDIAERIISDGARSFSICGLPSGVYAFELTGTIGRNVIVSGAETTSLSAEKSSEIEVLASVGPPMKVSLVGLKLPDSPPLECLSKITVSLTPIDRRHFIGEKSEMLLTQDCTATFPSVLSGRYRVEVIPLTPKYYVNRIDSEDYESMDNTITVGPILLRDGLVIEVKQGVGEISGVISNRKDTKDMRPLILLAFKHNEDGSLCDRCLSSFSVVADEKFETPSLAAASYSVVVIKELPSSPLDYSNLLSQVSPSLTSAVVKSGQTQHLSVKYVDVDQRLLIRRGTW